jgi:hypothetical protein
MSKTNGRVRLIQLGLAMVLAASLTGCAGYVDGGYGDDGYGYDGGPDIAIFGGDYGRGRDVHAYSHRGSVSRATVHSGSRGGHSGGGHGGRR